MRKDLKQRLATAEPIVGSWTSLGHPAIAEMMCGAGYEWIGIDVEHSALSLSRVEELIRVIDLAGAAPLVRLTCNDPQQIKRVMDSGAHGVIVPAVTSRDDVLRGWRAMHYPPRGDRGVGLSRAQGYGASFAEYRVWLESSAVFVPQIEHVAALEHLDEIFGSPEVDAYLVGPYDLSASMGIAGQFDHPEFVHALERIRDAAARHGTPAGIHIVEPEPAQLAARVAEGYRLIAYSVDFRMIEAACRWGLRAVGR